ncbi:Tol-Pal system beta propeller repeat protein TolB [Celeribacter marinus]|uniref:Tol-Pal system protein TolB n=1 Tax=Celeribacter marinus TaxID=1397108 RepID=A0A0P0ACK5_9RHOB|nr:Tol-Pal system beta propeller repeat protein TolB [Celeribacter marinus]ALI56658.1 TolB protein precursor [Celeribacter marinus]SFK62166.1 TolB protein [Celeribacter marinus]
MIRLISGAATLTCSFATAIVLSFSVAAVAQDTGPLKIDITQGVIEPVPLAIPDFIAETADAAEFARQISDVIAADLVGTGLFREIPPSAHISQVSSFSAPVQYADWKAINAQGLVTGAVSTDADGNLSVKFRVFDVFADVPLGDGLQLGGTTRSWRRIAHKVADVVYSRITGEGPYFDSRVVFVSQTGPKNDRKKRLAVMDYDGENMQFLTDDSSLVLAPRFSPTGDRVLYTSYESGFPQITMLDVGTVTRRTLPVQAESMSFAPRFSPDGGSVVYSVATGANTDLYRMTIASGQAERLTSTPAIETAPSFSPDGSQIVFESDRSGTQQLYIMSASGGEAKRISFGQGRYGTPVWSPRGDLIAFTKQANGRFHIGVMRTDGSEERLLTASFLDEGPSWSPNGRVIMFTRESQGAGGETALYTVDISGRNLKRLPTNAGASDPAWSPLLR